MYIHIYISCRKEIGTQMDMISFVQDDYIYGIYTCMYMYIYVYIYIFVYNYMYIYVHIYIYNHMHIDVPVFFYVHASYMNTFVCVEVYART